MMTAAAAAADSDVGARLGLAGLARVLLGNGLLEGGLLLNACREADPGCVWVLGTDWWAVRAKACEHVLAEAGGHV